jgi:hypothetical protein
MLLESLIEDAMAPTAYLASMAGYSVCVPLSIKLLDKSVDQFAL